MYQNETKVGSTEIYKGVIVHLTKDDIVLDNGYKAVREVVHHPGGVCIAALDDQQNLYFVKQYRYPFGEALTELPAGKLEYGEDPLECGIRELKEEIGATVETMTYLGCIYPTVAYDTEIIHMYMAEGLSFGKQKLDDGEFLDVEKIPLNKAAEMVMNGEMPDAKTTAAVLKVYLKKAM